MRPTLPRRRRLRSPDNVASEEAELTWLDALTQKALARELPTRAEARNILQGTDDELMDVVAAAVKVGAKRVCLVASGRGPTDADVTRVSGAIGKFKEQHPDVEVCACLGLLSDGQAER